MAPQAPVGIFVQPPASGTVFGPQNVTEVEGLGLTFPEITLRMPRLRLPSIQRSRRNARMELDRATAPFMQQAAPSAAAPTYAAPAAAAPTYAAPTYAAPTYAAPTYAAAPTMVAAAPAPQMMAAPAAAPTMMMAAPSAAPTMMMAPSYAPTMMMQLAPQYVPVAPQAPQAPQTPNAPRAPEAPQAPPYHPQYGPPSPPDCEAPRGPACGPNYYGATTQPQPATSYAAINARLQQLEATERRIDQKLARLQSAMAEFQPGPNASSAPARPIGGKIPPSQTTPLVQPSTELRPLSPPPVMAVGYAETGRQAQPISYQVDRGAQAPAEPRRIFQPIQQPSQRISQVIRQPAG